MRFHVDMIQRVNNISKVYNPYKSSKKECSFGAASDYSLSYVQKYREQCLPERVKLKIDEILSQNCSVCPLTLYDLHLELYAPLRDKKFQSLEELQQEFPEFSGVVGAEKVLKHKSPNIKKLLKKIPLSELSIFVIKEHWGNLKTYNEIASELGLKDRSALAWYVQKMNIPGLGKAYQLLLKASDEKENAIIAEKTRVYNQKHYEQRVAKNAEISKRPEVIEFNRCLMQEMWDRMPELRTQMIEYRRMYPGLSYGEFNNVFWGQNPHLKERMSEVRKEIANEYKFKNRK